MLRRSVRALAAACSLAAAATSAPLHAQRPADGAVVDVRTDLHTDARRATPRLLVAPSAVVGYAIVVVAPDEVWLLLVVRGDAMAAVVGPARVLRTY